jgi:hypothetical protein
MDGIPQEEENAQVNYLKYMNNEYCLTLLPSRKDKPKSPEKIQSFKQYEVTTPLKQRLPKKDSISPKDTK